MNLVSLLKMCLPETSGRFWVGKNMSYLYSIRNVLKNGDFLSPFPLTYAVVYAKNFAISRIQVCEVECN